MGELEKILDMIPSLIVIFITIFLGQVQSIDYSGDEVHVTLTDGTGCAAQKVSARISLVPEGPGCKGEESLPPRSFAFGSLPGALFDF